VAVTLFKYLTGEELRERASVSSSAMPSRLVVTRRGYFEGQPAYMMDEVETAEFRGWFSEDMLEPYDAPLNNAAKEDTGKADSG
jgi:hypothetical protein